MSETPARPSLQEGGLEALTGIAATVAHSRDLDAALASGLDSTLLALDLQVGAIYLLDEETGELHSTRHYRGVPAGYPETVARFRRGEGLVGKALQGDAPVVVRDLAATKEARAATREIGLRSFVFVPLYARGRAVGVMPVGGYTLRDFSEGDLRLLGAVGGILGGAVDNARLLGRTQQHLAHAQSLREMDRAIVEDRDVGEVIAVIAREAARLGGGDSAVALIEGEEVRVACAHGAAAVQALGVPPALGGTPLLGLLRSAPAVVGLEASGGGSMKAMVCALQAGERMIGGVVVVRSGLDAGQDDLWLLAGFGQQAAVALAKTRARDLETRRAAQLALVAGASEVAASTLDTDALLGALARYIQRSFGYYSVGVYLVDHAGRQVVLAGAAGAAIVMPRSQALRFGSGIIGWVAEHGEYILANDVRREPRFAPGPMEATRAELAVPVRLAGEVVAVINVESDRVEAFDEGDVLAVDGIASQVASAIRNARLFEEKVRALRNLEILQEITNVLNSDLDLDALLDRIARRSVEALYRAQMGAVLLFADGALGVRSSFGYRQPESLEAIRLDFHEGLPGNVFVTGAGRFVASSPGDHGRHAAAFREAAGGLEPRSALCVPIALPREKLGVLLLSNFSAADAFDGDDLSFASTLADQAAIAIGNALQLRRIVELDRHRREYLSNVSHELRTPLTVIQGYLEALVEGTAAGQEAHFLRVAQEQCHRLGRMIDEIVEVARIEKGVAQRHVEWTEVALPGLVRRVLQGLRAEAIQKAVVVTDRVPPDLPPVAGDERLLHLLVQNLVENAVKFTPRGGSVEVSLEELDGGAEVLLRVKDNGIGIAAEHHERIFEKFYTVSSGPNRSHAGAGIGLYLAREVAAIHDGSLSVDSRPGDGSCFQVRLPHRRLR
jgi:signal transduction histidine kinase/putative methionine-R-sulfoxide reductase with GAF domain